MKVIVDFNQFIQEQSKSHLMPLSESYQFKNLQPGSITYKHILEYIHTKMWRIAIDLVYGKDWIGNPLQNTITIKNDDDVIPAAELFYKVWENIDRYTSPSNVSREDLEGKMYHLSDGATTDYRNAEWYIKMQQVQSINAGYSTTGHLSPLIDDLINMLNKFPGNSMYFSEDKRQYNFQKPVNVRRLIRNAEITKILKLEEDYYNVSAVVSELADKKKVVESFKMKTSRGVQQDPSFGLEDYADAIANCRGFLQMKLNQPSMTPTTIGWNFLHYINNYIYEFVLYYVSVNFAEQVKGYK